MTRTSRVAGFFVDRGKADLRSWPSSWRPVVQVSRATTSAPVRNRRRGEVRPGRSRAATLSCRGRPSAATVAERPRWPPVRAGLSIAGDAGPMFGDQGASQREPLSAPSPSERLGDLGRAARPNQGPRRQSGSRPPAAFVAAAAAEPSVAPKTVLDARRTPAPASTKRPRGMRRPIGRFFSRLVRRRQGPSARDAGKAVVGERLPRLDGRT